MYVSCRQLFSNFIFRLDAMYSLLHMVNWNIQKYEQFPEKRKRERKVLGRTNGLLSFQCNFIV
jgi:hypothetical protein